MAKRKVSGEGALKLPTTGEGRAARLDALRAEERAIAQQRAAAEPKKKRQTATGRVGGGGKVVEGRHRSKYFAMRVDYPQLNAIHGLAAQRAPYAPDPVTWSASEYMRALVALDGIGAVNWKRIGELAKSAESDVEEEG